MRKVLVTGASGFVGGHIVQVLRSRGVAVRCLVRPTSRLDFIAPSAPEMALGNVTEPETLAPALEGIDAVVHCAGLTRAASRIDYFQVNEGGTGNLYTACKKRKEQIQRIVHISSLAAFGPSADGKPVTEDSIPHPISDYGKSKLAGQRLAEACLDELPLSILVPPAVYGPRDVDFYVYFKLVARGIMPFIGSKERQVSLIYVKDLAEAAIRVLFSDRAVGRTYLVDDGCIHTWASVGDAIGSAMMRTPKRIRLPIAAVRGMGAIGDFGSKLTRKPWLLNSQKVEDFLQAAWTCSSQRIRNELGFRDQYPFDQGIRETLHWYRDNKWL
jgi:nucleoside-diphosphate-sugar epimerase